LLFFLLKKVLNSDDSDGDVLSKALGDVESSVQNAGKKPTLQKSEAGALVSNLKLLKAAVSACISRRLIAVEEGAADKEFEMAPDMVEALQQVESEIEHMQKTLSGNKLGVSFWFFFVLSSGLVVHHSSAGASRYSLHCSKEGAAKSVHVDTQKQQMKTFFEST